MSLWVECSRWVVSVTVIVMFVSFANVYGTGEVLGNCDNCKFAKHKSRDIGAEARLAPICGRQLVYFSFFNFKSSSLKNDGVYYAVLVLLPNRTILLFCTINPPHALFTTCAALLMVSCLLIYSLRN